MVMTHDNKMGSKIKKWKKIKKCLRSFCKNILSFVSHGGHLILGQNSKYASIRFGHFHLLLILFQLRSISCAGTVQTVQLVE